MREDLLHFIWKYKKLPLKNLVTTNDQEVSLIDLGLHNQNEGPDFFNAKIKIGDQLWAGNVELHINASDWYAHRHEQDHNYDNVILHVVWNDDMRIFRNDQSVIPTLELKNYIPTSILNSYHRLFEQQHLKFINCERDIAKVDEFTINNWLSRLYVERLERKSELIEELLSSSKNDWEYVLFALLLKNFGLKVNGDSFFSLAKAMDYSLVRKLQNQKQLESTLFGLAGLLQDEMILDPYYLGLKQEYTYQSHKFDLSESGILKPQFFKLRPTNFPTIRLSQFAQLYHKESNLFSKVISNTDLDHFYTMFNIGTTPYWDDHFTFGKKSKKSRKKLSKNFSDLLLINTIIPVKFAYARYLGKDINNKIFSLAESILAEQNSVISNFKTLKIPVSSSKESQSILQLYNEYCTKNKCLQCAIGGQLLNGNK